MVNIECRSTKLQRLTAIDRSCTQQKAKGRKFENYVIPCLPSKFELSKDSLRENRSSLLTNADQHEPTDVS